MYSFNKRLKPRMISHSHRPPVIQRLMTQGSYFKYLKSWWRGSQGNEQLEFSMVKFYREHGGSPNPDMGKRSKVGCPGKDMS